MTAAASCSTTQLSSVNSATSFGRHGKSSQQQQHTMHDNDARPENKNQKTYKSSSKQVTAIRPISQQFQLIQISSKNSSVCSL